MANRRERIDRVGGVPWGAITLALLAVPSGAAVIAKALAVGDATREAGSSLLPGLLIALLASFTMGAIARGVQPRPRFPTLRVSDAVVSVVRTATNPFLVGLPICLLLIVPLETFLYWLHGVVNSTAHVAIDALLTTAMIVSIASTTWLFRPLAIVATAEALFVERVVGRQSFDWSGVKVVDLDAGTQSLLVRFVDGTRRRIHCPSVPPGVLGDLAQRLDALAKAAVAT